MMDKYKYDSTKQPICPHCDEPQSDAWEWGDRECGQIECGSCCKPFLWSKYVKVTWTTRKLEEK